MASLLDMIGSTVVFGVLVLMVVELNIFALETNTQNALAVATQERTIGDGLAAGSTEMLEADLVKIGYRCAASPAITLADSDRITFKADLDNDGDLDSVKYSVSGSSTGKRDENLNLKGVVRRVNTELITGHWLDVTAFRFRYFDNRGRLIPTPVSAPALPTIRSIQVQMMGASNSRIQNDWERDFAQVYSETLISPANLQE